MWNRVQNLPWALRWAIKWLLFGATLFLISFPDPRLFVRHVQHWQDPNALIDPDLAALQPWVAEVKRQLKPEMEPRKALKTVERFVYKKVPYRFDWETWGSADYLPTLAEVLDKGKEDCDGQAVVAASILQNLGYRAELVTDFAHVWVKTDKGETMQPGKRKSVIAGKTGLEVHWETLTKTLPRALGYSVAPFPLIRELIVLGVLWLVLLRPGVGRRVGIICAAVMLEGLMFLRVGGVDWKDPVVWAQWWGLLHLVGGVFVLFVLGWRATRAGRRASAIAAAPADK
ncbi:MAG TPA: transglutaminase-like domain-containing protein [Phycisphaerae bacterium]|nr:transglutaminase-like domain-containing protein [Phycisphaerae bacterium]